MSISGLREMFTKKSSKKKNLKFGISVIPENSKLSIEENIEFVKKSGLDHLEIAFVNGLYLSEKRAYEINYTAAVNKISLSIHAPYFINLSSPKKDIVEKSKELLLNVGRFARTMGAEAIVFHTGFYYDSPKNTYDKIKKNIEDIKKSFEDEFLSVKLSPETMGKKKEFGDLEEIISLSQEVKGIFPCIDFAHIHARTKRFNSYEEFNKILKKLEKRLGIEYIKNMHIHISGIEYNGEGERYHLNLLDSDVKFDEWIEAINDYGVEGIVVVESPEPIPDALRLKKLYYDKP